MSTATASPSRSSRKVSGQRRLAHPYPLFGFRWEVLAIAQAHRHDDIHNWLLIEARANPAEDWSSLWSRCRTECRRCFKDIWLVRLPRRSRRLLPGEYAFDPVTDFLHIPGSPPPVVEDCYREAFAELPRHRFVYLDLLWDMTPAGLQLASVANLRAAVLKQEQLFKRKLRTDRALIEAARTRQLALIATLNLREGVARKIPLVKTPDEARQILGLSHDQLDQLLQRQAGIELTKFDPVIVFEEPALLERAGGHMPLGLVAHWD